MTLGRSLQIDTRGSVVERRTLDRSVAGSESIDSWLKLTLGLKSATGTRELINLHLKKKKKNQAKVGFVEPSTTIVACEGKPPPPPHQMIKTSTCISNTKAPAMELFYQQIHTIRQLRLITQALLSSVIPHARGGRKDSSGKIVYEIPRFTRLTSSQLGSV